MKSRVPMTTLLKQLETLRVLHVSCFQTIVRSVPGPQLHKGFAMKKAVLMNALAWLGAIAAALSLALATPSESSVMGRLPVLIAQPADKTPVSLPEGLPNGRTLAVVTFKHAQRVDAEEWIQGLQLRDAGDIQWIRMPVIEDPRDDARRAELQDKLLARYPSGVDRAALMPVFTDRDAFLRVAALDNHDQVYVLVLNRQGEILARAEGRFDAAKAEALRETLQAHEF
jgi:hypothetical protein